MAWDPDALRMELLEEFGAHLASYDGDNVWFEQAQAAADFARSERAQEGRSKREFGECLDCRAPVQPGKRRCAKHLQAAAADLRRLRSAKRLQAKGRAEGRKDKRALGECLDCREPAVEGRRRCAKHLALCSQRTIAYQRRVVTAPVSARTKAAIAASARERAQRRT